MARETKRKLHLRKKHIFVADKYVEDVKQDEKSIPDLVESIMKAPGLVKDGLRLILFKIYQSRPKTTKIAKVQNPRIGLPITPHHFKFAIFGRASGRIF